MRITKKMLQDMHAASTAHLNDTIGVLSNDNETLRKEVRALREAGSSILKTIGSLRSAIRYQSEAMKNMA